MTTPSPNSILHNLRTFISEDPTSGRSPTGAWDRAWKEKVTPWDAGDVQPALKELVEERWEKTGVDWELSLKGRKALVAGCGKGYDATYFATKGLEVLGMDLSATAVESARNHLAASPNIPSGVHFEAADFFTFPLPFPLYSLAYDYTFFCALPPSLRSEWGVRYAELIEKDGLLITLQFPIDGERKDGPPYSISEKAYEEVLNHNFEKIFDEIPGKSAEGHEGGREKMVVWRRKG